MAEGYIIVLFMLSDYIIDINMGSCNEICYEFIIANVKLCFHLPPKYVNKNILEEMFFYHVNDNLAYNQVHHIYFNFTCEVLRIDPAWTFLFKGSLSYGKPVLWYSHPVSLDIKAFVGNENEVEVWHSHSENKTICTIWEKTDEKGKKIRPELIGYIFLLLHGLISTYRKFTIHAACVAHENQSLLILGPSGVGKSTLSVMLSKAGYQFQSDDITILEKQGSTVLTHAFLQKVKIRKLRFWEKHAVDIIKKHKVSYAYQANLKAVVYLYRTEDQYSYLSKVGQGKAFTHVMQQGNHFKMLSNVDAWLELCESIASLPFYTLYFGNKDFFDPKIILDILKTDNE